MLMLICDVIHDVVDKHVELFTSDNQGSLHWLDVPQQVQFKLCMTVRRWMQDKAPQYLKEYCISFSDSRQRLRSASRHLLSVPLLAVGPSLLLVRRRRTLYLTICVICHVAIVILDVS